MATPIFGASTTGAGSGSNSITYSSPNVSGSDTIGIVTIFAQTDLGGFAATWNGAACTSILGKTGDGGVERVASFYIINPTAGVTNVVATRTGTSNDFRSYAAFYTNAKQSGQPDASATINQQTTATLNGTVTTVAQDAMVFLFVRGENGETYSAGTNTFIRANANVSIPLADTGTNSFAPGANTVQVTSNSQPCYGVAWSIAPIAAVGPANLKSYNTNPKANIKSIDTNLIANVKSLNTNT